VDLPGKSNDLPDEFKREERAVAFDRSRPWQRCYLRLIALAPLVTLGCQNMPIDLARGPAPLRIPRPGEPPQSFEDSLAGGQVFAMYCNQCHNARALAERPFANFENVAAHMRVRANITGEEHAKLIAFLQRWHDVPSASREIEPPPKRFVFSQPIAELREEQQAKERAAQAAAPAPAANPGAGAQLPPALP
jgi:hypothetical protein